MELHVPLKIGSICPVRTKVCGFWVWAGFVLFPCLLLAQTSQQLSYRGRLLVGAKPFDGPVSFKFALLNAKGTETYWSNDGTSVAGSEPNGAVSLPVSAGKYTVILGDPTVGNMRSLPASVLQNKDVRLRIWCRPGTTSFARLLPDEKIPRNSTRSIAGITHSIKHGTGEIHRYDINRTARELLSGTFSMPRYFRYPAPSSDRVVETSRQQASAVTAETTEPEPAPMIVATPAPPPAASASPAVAENAIGRQPASVQPESTPSEPPASPPVPASSDASSAETKGDELIHRTPHLDCDPAGSAEPGKTITVNVYTDTGPRQPGETPGANVIVPFPPEREEIPVVVYLVLSHQFRLKGQADSKELVIKRAPPAEPAKVTFKLKVENNAEGVGHITALFFYQGYPCGRVSRSIPIGYSDESDITAQGKPSAPPAPAATGSMASSMAIPRDGPDMTIVVIQTDRAPVRYQYFVLAPHAKEPRGQVLNWDNYSDPTPQTLLELSYERFGNAFSKEQTRASLVSLGLDLFAKIPEKVGDTLRELIDNGKAPRSVLVFSDEPYFAWELVIPHWPDKDPPKAPLGATSSVARWTADPSEIFRSPARHIAVGKTLFWAPSYDTNKLTHSGSEQAFLQNAMQAQAIDPATYTGICKTLAGSDATILHFICHGSSGGSEGQQVGLPTILAQPEEQSADPETDLEQDTPEGESPAKRYYHASIIPGDFNDCMKGFCARRPLIFLNACQVGQRIKTWTASDGFGPKFLQLNAGGVVAPLWSVFDVTAESAARKFYTTLREHPEVPFADILRRIREEAYTSPNPPDGLSTFAAYCFYGDPLAVSASANNPP
jgi:hypothetical protein